MGGQARDTVAIVVYREGGSWASDVLPERVTGSAEQAGTGAAECTVSGARTPQHGQGRRTREQTEARRQNDKPQVMLLDNAGQHAKHRADVDARC